MSNDLEKIAAVHAERRHPILDGGRHPRGASRTMARRQDFAEGWQEGFSVAELMAAQLADTVISRMENVAEVRAVKAMSQISELFALMRDAYVGNTDFEELDRIIEEYYDSQIASVEAALNAGTKSENAD